MKSTLIALLLAATPVVASDPPTLQNLSKGESLRITFESTGCFHFDVHEFVFDRDEALTVDVTRTETRWDATQKKRVEVGRKPLGSTQLTDEDTAALDRLLAYYRSVPSGGSCTTVDTIGITFRKKGGKSKKESFIDGHCETLDNEDLLTLPDLVNRINSAIVGQRPTSP